MHLTFHLLLFLLHLQGLHLFGLILAVQLLPNRANFLLCLHFRLGENFPITGEKFLNLFFEVEVLIAFDGLVVFHSLRVELDESAGDFGRGVLGELELNLVIEQALGVVRRQLQLIITLH